MSAENKPSARRPWTKYGVWALLVVLAAGGITWRLLVAKSGSMDTQILHTVTVGDLEVTVRKDGELQAVNNVEVTCQVEGQTAITSIMKEGETVQAGQVLAVLDSSMIRQKLDDVSLELQRATNDLTNAREMLDIQKSQNAANLESAEVSVQLSNLDLLQYVEGLYPQQLTDARTQLEMATIVLKNKQDELGDTRRLAAKGYVTAADLKKSELDVVTAANNEAKARTAVTVFEKFVDQMSRASKQNAKAQADQRLIRVKRENASNLRQKEADVESRTQALAIITRRSDRLKEQLAATTIRAAQGGLVVYATSSDRNAREQIQEGSTVRERQPLFRIPDVSSMKAVVRLPEIQASRLGTGGGIRARVSRIPSYPRPVSAKVTKVSVLSDSGGRWWNPDSKEYPVDVTLDTTPTGLKPGMGCLVEIFIDRREKVVITPLSTIFASGGKSYVFLVEGGVIKPAPVVLGLTNETHAEITSGLSPDQVVVVLQAGQGRDLLEKAGIKVQEQPTSRRRGNRGGNGGLGSPGGGAPATIPTTGEAAHAN